jgi:hypothetical protein
LTWVLHFLASEKFIVNFSLWLLKCEQFTATLAPFCGGYTADTESVKASRDR